MKNVLNWIKSNILIVIFSILIVLVLPAAYFGSSMWRDGIVAQRKKDAEAQFQSVAKLDVNYTLPTYGAGAKPVELKSAPNTKITEWFKAQRDRLAEANTAIVKRAEDFNQGIGPDAAAVGRSEFKALVDGLFPSCEFYAEKALSEAAGKEAWDAMAPEKKAEAIKSRAAEMQKDKLNEMEDALLGKRGHPNPYADLLAFAKAGPPADPVKVADGLREMASRETEKVTAGKRQLTNEEQLAQSKALAERRLAEYQAAASGISLYAAMEQMPSDAAGLPIPVGKIDPEKIDAKIFFLYQWDYWILKDFFTAVKLANTDAGKQTDVEHSVVKRIEKIFITDPKGLYKAAEEASGAASSAAAPAAAVPGSVPSDPSVSITGRDSSPANTMYDVRRLNVTVVVSSARITEFLDAITRTNFMSITGFDITAVDEWGDLRDGYYYGGESVVRATISIETIWLRSWLLKYMPNALQVALEVPGASTDAGAGAAKTAAPAAAPAAGGKPGTRRGRG